MTQTQESQDFQGTKYPNIFKVIQCGVGFFIMFIAYNSAINLQSTVMYNNGFESLGFYNLSVICLVCGLSSFISPILITKFKGTNTCFVIGAIGNGVFILSSVLPALASQSPKDSDPEWYLTREFIYFAMISSSVLCGFGQGLLWTAEGFYISMCSNEKNKGMYFSLFWSIFQLS